MARPSCYSVCPAPAPPETRFLHCRLHTHSRRRAEFHEQSRSSRLKLKPNGGRNDIWNEVSAMLIASPIEDAEEWAIHDYEGFEGYSLFEYEGFGEVSKIAAFISEHGTLGGELLSYYNNLDDAQKAIEDHYAGAYESLSDFAREMTEQSGTSIPETLAYYIDYDAMARDMAMGDVITIETGHEQVHVFWAH